MIKWQNPPFSNYFSLFLAGIHNIHVFIWSPKGCDVISSEIFLSSYLLRVLDTEIFGKVSRKRLGVIYVSQKSGSQEV